MNNGFYGLTVSGSFGRCLDTRYHASAFTGFEKSLFLLVVVVCRLSVASDFGTLRLAVCWEKAGLMAFSFGFCRCFSSFCWSPGFVL